MIEQKMGNDPKDHAVSTGTVVKVKPPTLTESDKKRIFNAQEVNDRGEFIVNKLQDAINNNDVASVFVDEVIGSKKDRVINANITEDKRYITLQLEGDVEDRKYDLKNKNQLAKLVDDFVLIEYPKSGDQIKDWYRKSTETDIDPRIAKSNKSRTK